MAESAREIDLDPRTYVGLSFPLRADNNNDFALTRNSLQQAQHNLKNLFLTYPGERVAQPEFGSRIRALCFEPDTQDLEQKIEEEVRRSVSQWLSYINIIKVSTKADQQNQNKISVSVEFSTSLNPSQRDLVTVSADTSTSTDY
tara:strand:- start:2138 stop:2569 length:432 start_codon:yes stop_codon:yes gene_type:complete